MQALASRMSSQRVAVARKPASATLVAPFRTPRVVCKAENKATEAVSIATAFAAALPALLAASPAFALVDDRLNGDGVGLPFGINDGVLGWAIFGVFVVMWAIWYNGQKDLGNFEDKDSGLGL